MPKQALKEYIPIITAEDRKKITACLRRLEVEAFLRYRKEHSRKRKGLNHASR